MKISQDKIEQVSTYNIAKTDTRSQLSAQTISMREEFTRALEETTAEFALVKILIAEFKYRDAPDFIDWKHKAQRQFRKSFPMSDKEYLTRRAQTLETLGLGNVIPRNLHQQISAKDTYAKC